MRRGAAIVTMDDVPRPPRIPYLRVADALRERLDAGEWLPGEQLPSARQLGREYEVNPSTAARSVRVLAEEGRVEIIPAWGVFVTGQGA